MTEFASKKIPVHGGDPATPGNGPFTGEKTGALSVIDQPSSTNTTVAQVQSWFLALWQWLLALGARAWSYLSYLWIQACNFQEDFIVYTKTSQNSTLIIVGLILVLLCAICLLYILTVRRCSRDKTETSDCDTNETDTPTTTTPTTTTTITGEKGR